MIRKNRLGLLAGILFLSLIASAQEFHMHASLGQVLANGFYRIPVSVELSAIARADLSDVRIQDQAGGFVPYIVQSHAPQVQEVGRVSQMIILGNEQEKNHTIITFDQQTSAITYSISIDLSNTLAERYAQVSGSNDNMHWYIINDHVILQRADRTGKGTYVQKINLPATRYRYFKLKIDNAHTDPLNIIGAQGYSDSIKLYNKPELLQNPELVITQKDSSDHISYVVLRNAAPYMVNDLSLQIAGPAFYERQARLYILSSDKDSSSLQSLTATLTLSSAKSAHFVIPCQKALALLLEIDNKDNPPLKVLSAATKQESESIVAWLEKGNKYQLLAGSEQAAMPQYDLARFADSIPGSIPALSYGAFTAISKNAPVTSKSATHGYWLWIIIVSSVAMLGTLTYRLMKDVKKSNIS